MLVQITGWRQYVKEGEQYLNCAQNAAQKRPDVFTPTILYNLTTMAIEKFLMGFLMYNGTLADNHTMADILASVERITGKLNHLTDDFHHLDSFQEICDLDAYRRREPNREEILNIIACGVKVREFTMQSIPALTCDFSGRLTESD